MMCTAVQQTVPEVGLRVPGPWRSVDELAKRLPGGFHVEEDRMSLPGGQHMYFHAMPADDQFPDIFRSVCRRIPRREECRTVDRYAMNAVVAGLGGSRGAARLMLEAGMGLVQAGGAGVFIDNSMVAHGGGDWLELAQHRQDSDAIFYAFVNFVGVLGDVRSHGMHVLGQRDGIIEKGRNGRRAVDSLEDLLRMVFSERRAFKDQQLFRDTRGRRFRLCSEKFYDLFKNHPLNNPYGGWRLEPLR